MAKIPVGLQMYTLRDETAQDFTGTLKKVADIGYQVVEFAGYGNLPAKELKSVMDGLGISSPSSHVAMTILEDADSLKKQIEYSLEIGQKYIICPMLESERLTDQEKFIELVETFRKVGEEVKQHGLQLAYHNHDFEFEKVDGDYALDRLYASLDPSLMVAELDLYWVAKAGIDPKSYLEQYKGRCPIIHVKDMTKDERKFFAEVGQGSIDFPSIFSIAEEVGIEYYLVEQDRCERPPLESIQISMDYLKSIGIA